jgi:ParB family chromosome partitioning protein
MNQDLNSASPQANEENVQGQPAFSYKGSVSGLKGLLTTKLAEGLANVVNTIDRVTDFATGTHVKKSEGGTESIAIEKIVPCPDQPRQVFEAKSLEELSNTMRELGQAQAITVRRTETGFEIISGERRFRAAKLAGMTHLDCVIKDCSAQEGRFLALVENVQRQDLLPIEEAHFLKKVLSENNQLSLEKLAKTLGSHKSTLSEKIQLTEIPEELQNILYSKGRTFTHRHWRVVSRIQDASQLKHMFLQALEHQLSVAELERSLAALGVKKAPRRKFRGDEAQTSFEKFNVVKREGSTFRIRAMTIDKTKLSGDSKARLVEELESLLSDLRQIESEKALDDNA